MIEKQLSNWGRWGADDQQGTLNYITPAILKQAMGLVKNGRVYSLASVLGGHGAYFAGSLRKEPWRFTAIDKRPTPSQMSLAEDMLTISSHSGTHIDALCHVWYDHQLYTGFSADEVDGIGANKNSIENLKSLVGRGIMLDVAGNKGVKHLDRGYAITARDLEDCLIAQGLQTEPGDILLVRTGWIQVFYQEGPEAFHHEPSTGVPSEPGLSYHLAEWLHQKQTCAVGLDNWACEVRPSELPDYPLPFHELFIRDLGGYIMETLDLEELARDKVYEFLFMAAPLQISRGCGSPINPLAIV
ncbi:hypothetical protein ES703_104842 [subsurface metagenome]